MNMTKRNVIKKGKRNDQVREKEAKNKKFVFLYK